MMLTKPKPDSKQERKASPLPIMNVTKEETSADDREQDLERRLALLGIGTETETTTLEDLTNDVIEPNVEEEVEEEEKKKEDNLMSFDPIPVSAPPVIESKPEPVVAAPAPVKPNKSALLQRIMAAQERAKQAQMKQAASTSTMKQQSTTTILPAPTQIIVNAKQEKEKMMKALNGIVDDAIKKEVKQDDRSLKPPSLPPPSFAAPPAPPAMMAPPTFAAPPAPPAMMAPPSFAASSAMMAPPPPPPSFDIFEQQQKKEEEEITVLPPPPAPPAFGMIENDTLGLPPPEFQAPSAPPPEESLMDNFDGITPMAPPPMYPGEEQVQDDSEVFDFDADGNPLSAEQKRKMMEEQRIIMEQIKRQSNENKASEAAVRANAFETRMMGNNTVSAPTPRAQVSSNTAEVDFASLGMDPAEIEEQRKILEEIEKQNRKSRGGTSEHYESPAIAPPSLQEHAGVERNPFLTDEEVAQMEEDRKLAERLQNEENATASDYPGNRSRRAGASSGTTAAKKDDSTWWDYIVGSDTSAKNGDGKRSAEINVSRPSGQRALNGSSSNDYESESLLNRNGRVDAGEARVAESKPLFSCVVDSVSNAASAAAYGVNSMAYGEEEEEVHGIDTTSFLAVPKLGDERGASGS